MAVGIPDNTSQVEDRIKADVQRAASDSNPYIKIHWLRSLIFGIARRIFDFYLDLQRTEQRVMPDTADDETAPRWGLIFIGQKNEATIATGKVIAQGTIGSSINIGASLVSGDNEYIVTSNVTISAQSLSVLSITRSGATATVITTADHNLSSFIPVTIAGADQTEYNLTDAEITVTGLDTFTYQIEGTPADATGTITASFTSASVEIDSIETGSGTNLDLDTELKLQSPIVGVNDSLYVDFGAIGGGSDEETTPQYKARYLDKIRNPVAHFSANDIIAKAKEITGVTRVFVESSGEEIGTIATSSLTRSGSIAKAVTATPHGFDDGQETSITGADQPEYNVNIVRIIVENSTTFYYVIGGTPISPATGTINAATSIPLGMVRTFFMRDNDPDPIPTASEVQTVKDAIDTIRPANTSINDNIVKAPDPITVDYTFTQLIPNTVTMRAAVEANIQQFHEEGTTVGENVDQDAYRSAIISTVDTETGDIVESFELSAPIGDIVISSGQIAIKGTVTYP